MWRLNIMLGGMTPLYFHMVNVVLHCAVTALLMYTCKRAVFDDSRLAFLAALLFAVHPIHTEATFAELTQVPALIRMTFPTKYRLPVRAQGPECPDVRDGRVLCVQESERFVLVWTSDSGFYSARLPLPAYALSRTGIKLKRL
ncbi:hypothetical protein Z043_122189 [Scleropages formosus]|uniref:Uncharacterized protein n=1 Tax=Scleropages formosus TaxID=113540 RepID=A0A0P7UFM1_SCLFO|nr:hypothetical protein Z043_122189 [Scleropages formosus]